MNTFASTCAAMALAATAGSAVAADFHFTGNIVFNNDVVRIGFHLDNPATGVKVWTDGFMNGLNFDPITAVWNVTAGGTLVGENDDDATIGPGQTYYDSGLVLGTLAGGDYLFTIAAFPNFLVGPLLSDGFSMDQSTPIAIGDWCQPASQGCANQKGTFYSVRLSGVDDATAPAVPEPETYALLLGGLALTGWMARRRKSA